MKLIGAPSGPEISRRCNSTIGPSAILSASPSTLGGVRAQAHLKLVLLGMMTKMPVAGVVWQTIHYLLGFQRLGYDVYYVEAHARTPSMLMRNPDDDASVAAALALYEAQAQREAAQVGTEPGTE